jgi:hypothetical protein
MPNKSREQLSEIFKMEPSDGWRLVFVRREPACVERATTKAPQKSPRLFDN